MLCYLKIKSNILIKNLKSTVQTQWSLDFSQDLDKLLVNQIKITWQLIATIIIAFKIMFFSALRGFTCLTLKNSYKGLTQILFLARLKPLWIELIHWSLSEK